MNINILNLRYNLCALCCDETGGIPIIFSDREVRKLIGKSVFEIMLDEDDEVSLINAISAYFMIVELIPKIFSNSLLIHIV